jgi:formamidopyrimidine-DNA glycosylase
VPELPDVEAYLAALRPRIEGARLDRVRVLHPFALRSVEPSPAAVAGRAVVGLRRLGKRIVIALEGEFFVVLHLMVAGRLHWRPAGRPSPATTPAGWSRWSPTCRPFGPRSGASATRSSAR